MGLGIMRIELQKVKAKDCPVDVFVYLKSCRKFIYVDDVNVGEKTTELIFELGISKKGLVEDVYNFPNNKILFYFNPWNIQK